jgi:hypothetical protein
MIDPADWERMSWHARENYMKRHRSRPNPVGSRPVPLPVDDAPNKVGDRPYRNQGIVRRCGECGAWMIDVCGTDHGRRYES